MIKEEKNLPVFLEKLSKNNLKIDKRVISRRIINRSSSSDNISTTFNKNMFNININRKIKEIISIISDNKFLNVLLMNNLYKSKTRALVNILLQIIQNPQTEKIKFMIINIKEVKKFIKENVKFRKINVFLNLISNKLNYIYFYLKTKSLPKDKYDIEYRKRFKTITTYLFLKKKIKNIGNGVKKRNIEKIKCKICEKNILLKFIEEHSPICCQEKDLISKIEKLNENITNLIESILLNKQQYYLSAFGSKDIIIEEKEDDKKNIILNLLKNKNIKIPSLDTSQNNSTKNNEISTKKNEMSTKKNSKKSYFNKFKKDVQSIKTLNDKSINNINLNKKETNNKNSIKNNWTENDINYDTAVNKNNINSSDSNNYFGDKFFNSSNSDKKSENKLEKQKSSDDSFTNKSKNIENEDDKISNKELLKDKLYEKDSLAKNKETLMGDAYFSSSSPSSYQSDKSNNNKVNDNTKLNEIKKEKFNQNNTSEENIKASFEYNKLKSNENKNKLIDEVSINIKEEESNKKSTIKKNQQSSNNNTVKNNEKNVKNNAFFDWNKLKNNSKIPSYTEKFGNGTFKFNFKNKKSNSKEYNINNDNDLEKIIDNEEENNNQKKKKIKKNNNIMSNTIDLKNIINKHNSKTNAEKVKKFIDNLDKIHSITINDPFEINQSNDILEYFNNIEVPMNNNLKKIFDSLKDMIKEKLTYLKRWLKIRNKLKKHTNTKKNFYNFSFRAKKDFLKDEIMDKYNKLRNNSNYDVIKENSNNKENIYKEKSEKFIKSKSESCLFDKKNNNKNFNSKIEPDDFNYINKLGEGAYGKVVKIKRISTGDLYALKIIPFQNNIEDTEIKSLINERNIFGLITKKYLVTAYFSFIYNNNCLFVMELIEGGDFKKLLKECGYLEVEDVKFYAAELIVAINYLHSKKIIHRDLKPENLLLDNKGHLKVADFGLSKIKKKNFEEKKCKDKLKNCNNDNFYMDSDTVGTPNYIAYEAFDKNYIQNESVDWWAVGCIIYELAIGIPTFSGSSREEVFTKIKNLDYSLPKVGYGEYELAPELKDLIVGFLEKNPSKRLGNNGLDEIKNHPFFKDFDWNKINYDFGPYVPSQIYEKDSKEILEEEQTLTNYLNKNFKAKILNNKNKNKNITISKNFEMIRFDLLHQENHENWKNKIDKINWLNKAIFDLKNEKNKLVKNYNIHGNWLL